MHGLLPCVLVFCTFQPVHCDNAAASCGNFMKDWYPSVKPQSSAASFILNVSDENGNFSKCSWRFPTYGSKTVQTGTNHVKCVCQVLRISKAHDSLTFV